MSTRERAIPADLRDALASTRDVTVHKLPDGVAEGANDLRALSQDRLIRSTPQRCRGIELFQACRLRVKST
jgi:hypothetical protein